MSYFEMGALNLLGINNLPKQLSAASAQSPGQVFAGRALTAATGTPAASASAPASAPRPPGTLPAWALPAAAAGGVVLLAVLLRKRRNPSRGRRRRARRRR